MGIAEGRTIRQTASSHLANENIRPTSTQNTTTQHILAYEYRHKNDWIRFRNLLLYHDVLFVSQAHLKVWIGHTSGDLFEQRLLDFLKLCWLNDIQNLLDFTQKHHLIVREEAQETTWRATRQSSRGCSVIIDKIPLSDCRFWAKTSEAHGSPAKMTESFINISPEFHGEKKNKQKENGFCDLCE